LLCPVAKQIRGIKIGLNRDDGLVMLNQTPRKIKKAKNAKYLQTTIQKSQL